jgi:hypothetical protein
MNYNDKARELVEKFRFIPLDHENVEPTDIYKQCALIAVDEILDATKIIVSDNEIIYSNNWQSVKTAITKM